MPPAPLVGQLDSTNSWQRDTAQRLLLERSKPEVIQALEKPLEPLNTPLGRALVLQTLNAHGQLPIERLLAAAADPSQHLRETAVQLARKRLVDCPELRDAVYALAGDESPRVRFQVALALGDLDDARALNTSADLLIQSPQDLWLRLAVLSGLNNREVPFLTALLKRSPSTAEGQLTLLTELGTLIGARNKNADINACAQLFAGSPEAPVAELAVVAGITAGLETAGTGLREKLQPPNDETKDLNARFPAVLELAQQLALQTDAKPELRLIGIAILSQSGPDQLGRVDELLAATEPAAVQTAAARAIASASAACQRSPRPAFDQARVCAEIPA